MVEEKQSFESESTQEPEGELIKDTDVLVYHIPTGIRFQIKAKVKKGSGKISINGVPIFELIERGKILKIEDLMKAMSRERLKRLDIDLNTGDASTDALPPPILSYAFAKALTNLLGQL
ncbi:MAG: hypothetical protein NZ937_01955 [Armatimonadetes bacterium]|nr:hypothetical protein [Armatimonadota bacterium]